MAEETNGMQEQQAQQESKAEAIDYDKLASLIDGKQKVAEENVMKSYLKQQGLSQEEMAQAIKAYKDKREAEKPDVDGMRAEIAQLKQQILQDNLDKVATSEALKLGLDSKAMPYVLRMADMSKAVKTDGTISTEEVTNALNKVLTDIPALKPSVNENKGFQVGGTGSAKGSNAQQEEETLKNIFLNNKTIQSII